MTQSDYFQFSAEFRRLSAALAGYKQNPEEAKAKADAYFHVLKQFPLDVVVAKADAWLSKETKFPKPAEWAQVVVRKAVELSTMTPAEGAEYRRAEQLGYEDGPCACPQCLQAGVSEKPIRYVPTLDRDERPVQMLDTSGQKMVTAGHWAHGSELARWYQARGDFWDTCYRLGLMSSQQRKQADKRPVTERLEQLVSKLGL